MDDEYLDGLESMAATLSEWMHGGFKGQVPLGTAIPDALLRADAEIKHLRGELAKAREGIDVAWVAAHKWRNANKLVGPYPNDHEKTRIWYRSLYHAGKDLCESLKPYRTRAALEDKQHDR